MTRRIGLALVLLFTACDSPAEPEPPVAVTWEVRSGTSTDGQWAEIRGTSATAQFRADCHVYDIIGARHHALIGEFIRRPEGFVMDLYTEFLPAIDQTIAWESTGIIIGTLKTELSSARRFGEALIASDVLIIRELAAKNGREWRWDLTGLTAAAAAPWAEVCG